MTAPAIPASAARRRRASSRRPPARTRRNAELALLVFAMVLVAAYAAAVEASLLDTVTAGLLGPAADAARSSSSALHMAVRFLAPYADPVLLPAVALINGLGVGFLRRLDLAHGDAGRSGPTWRLRRHRRSGSSAGPRRRWSSPSVLLVVVRDHRSLSRYAYTLGLVGIVLVMIPAVLPAQYSEVNGAKLWIHIGGFSIQPGEFAKLALLVFFAYYLVRKREVLSLASRRFLGIDFPRGRDLGPVLVVWLMSLLVLVFEKDLGTSLHVLRHVRGDALRRHRAGRAG